MDPVPGHLSCVFHWWCDLCCIMATVTRTFFDEEKQRPPPSQIKNVECQLQDWYTNLPNCLRVGETTVPHILVLQ